MTKYLLEYNGNVYKYGNSYIAIPDPSLVINPTKINVGATGPILSEIAITNSYANTWDASSNVPWIVASKQSEVLLQLSIDTNASTNIRLGTVDVSTRFGQIGTIDVSQAGAVSEYLSVNVSELWFQFEANTPCVTASFNITASGTWTLSDNMTWCTPSSTGGTGNQTITLSTTLNLKSQRSGIITITQGALTVYVDIYQCARNDFCCP
jgi:hypothetical protein